MFARSSLIDECWLFEGCSSHEYGMIRFGGRMYGCHRISAIFFLELDVFDETQQANHKCTNKNCWNPEHLYVGSRDENRIDSILKGEQHRGYNQHTGKTHCKNGHDISTPDKYYKYGNGQRKCKLCYKQRYDDSRGK